MRKYVASPFWTSLTSEVQALREALEEEDGPEGETPDSAPHISTPPSGSELPNIEYDLIVCPPGKIYVMPGGFMEPTERVASQIFDAYLTNVEPIFRLYHTPTLIRSMRDGAPYLDHPWDFSGNQALKRAVWMAGVNSMSESECFAITGENKADALNHYRRLVGISLAQADLVNTTDFATLQAFVTYLVRTTYSVLSRASLTNLPSDSFTFKRSHQTYVDSISAGSPSRHRHESTPRTIETLHILHTIPARATPPTMVADSLY
jgi:hypothetical protein